VTEATLKDEIHRQMTEAMKAGDRVRVDTLRMFSSAIRYKEDELGHALSDQEIGDVAAKEVKKRTESMEAFAAAGREELVAKERAERDVIAPWAPEQLDDLAVDALIDQALEATGATSVKEIGKVMGFVMGRARGRVDGTLVQEKVRARLES
jgi:uncharacterized protein YqeY